MYECVGSFSPPQSLPGLEASSWAPTGWASGWPEEAQALYEEIALVPGKRPRLAMFMVIRPGGSIPAHRDNPARENAIAGELTRLHLVLDTNPGCWSFHDGQWQQLEAGSVYLMDPAKEHGAVNWGERDRVHLVVDFETE